MILSTKYDKINKNENGGTAMIKTTEKWDEILADEFNSPSYKKLREFLKEEYFTHVVYPSM